MTVWWKCHANIAHLLLGRDDAGAVLAAVGKKREVAGQVSRLTSSTRLGRAIFGFAAILVDSHSYASTFDGVAIAYAVLKYISQSLKCRTIFATHYHMLIKEFELFDNIKFHEMLLMKPIR